MELIRAFGTERFRPEPQHSAADRKTRTEIMLARALNLRTTVAFVGSGCSAPLGYPTWRTLVASLVDETAALQAPMSEITGRLREIHKRLMESEFVPSRDFIFYAGLCQSLLDQQGLTDLHSRIAAIINAAQKNAVRATEWNPYEALKELPIRRYVTSNYDRELEQMLDGKADVDGGRLAFTQNDHGALAGFAVVGVPGMRDGVFHCHGDHTKPPSIVASESDYQKWYIHMDHDATTFRQSLDLLFSSNPILFLGFGMDDDDLLRPLRVFNADNPERRSSRLLFALIERTKNPREDDWMESMHDRYGVNFLCYDRPSGNDRERGKALCGEIRRLAEVWRTRADAWVRKPAIRRVHVDASAHGQDSRPKQPYQHYSAVMSTDDLAPKKTAEDIDHILDEIRKDTTRVLVVTGNGGSGKSWRVLKLLERMRKSRGRFKDGIFFWSSYYADDWLTGMDRALSYLEVENETTPREKRLKRFEQCLRSGRHIIIFDGFERLLRATGNSKVGVPYSQSVRTLLDLMVDNQTRSTVILTTRLMPEQLQKLIDNPPKDSHGQEVRAVVQFGVRGLTTEDLSHEDSAFPSMDDENLARVCSLCGGHSYALLLAAKFLKTAEPGAGTRFDEFRREISRRAPDSRNSAVIKLAIDAVDKECDGLASKLLQRLAVFMSPVDETSQDVCFSDASEGLNTTRTRKEVVGKLLDAKLVLPVAGGPPREPKNRRLLTVHPIVRSYVFYKWHGVATDALPNFTLAGFTSGNAACHPGEKGGEQVTALFDRFCTHAIESNEFEVRRSMARAAFGIMRSRMDSNTVPRWTRYDRYICLGLRLRYLINEITPESWDYHDLRHAAKKQSANSVLYADELAWLYNDIGLALCSEGSMADAYSLWEQGFEIDRVTDSEEEGGQYMVQSHLHMAHLFIELGRLRRASQFLATTERANAFYNDVDFAGRILGYRGLLAHLSGNLDEAGKLYGHAIEVLASDGRRNLRAESLFHRYWADLLLAKHDLVGADEKVEIALSLAREGEFPDLEAYARKSRAHVWRDRKRAPREARAEYNAAMTTAEERGIKRLQADIHSELARLALDVGDWETARIRAMESLKLANELSLGLRRTHGLVVLGLAMDAAGNRKLARSYLRHALALANVQGYHLRGREAEQLLLHLGPEDAEAATA